MKDPVRSLLQRFRSPHLWRVFLLYAGVSWGVLQALDILDHFGLPDWFFLSGVLLLVLGLPIMLGTALIQAGNPAEFERLAPVEVRGLREELLMVARRWLTWPRAIMGGLGSFLVLAFIAFFVAWIRDPGRELDRDLIAVMPFHTVGPDLDLWSEGLVDLLSTALDGTGIISAADPRAVLMAWRKVIGADGNLGSRDEATEVSIGLGAGRMVIGTLIKTGPDAIRLTAELFDVRWASRAASVAVEGTQSEMIGLVDRLTVDLLKAVLEEGQLPDVRVSALTTISVPALKAYLEGQQAFRLSRFEEARQAFEEAVAQDSTFAIAAYGLSRADGWLDMEGARATALLLATRHTAGLRGRDSLLIVGWKRAEVDEDPSAIELFEELVGMHPEDFEAWNGLAETVFHHGHEVGYHLDGAMEALENAYAIDSTVAPAYFHGIQSAFILEDTARAQRWSRTYLELERSSVYAQGLRLGMALRLGSYLDRERAAAALDTASAEVLNRILWFVPPGRETLEYTDLVLRAASAQRFPDSDRAEAYRRLASEYRRNGRVRGSLALEDAARVLDGKDRDLLALVALRVAGILGDSTAVSELDRMVRAAAYPQKAPILSMLFASQGRLAEAAEAVKWARTAADSLAVIGDTASAREMTGAALAYRGHIAAAGGDTATAIDLLQSGIALLKPDWGGPRALHRFVLARLLRDHGGEDQAVTIFRAFRRPSSLEALSYLEAAELYERRGERESARRYFSWALELWSTADPFFAPWIDAANRGIERLNAAGAGADIDPGA